MARGNLLLGKAKGKLGSVVFAQANNEQITRSKPSSVRNPKSTGQNTQRAILATIAKTAALLSPIVDHSFAGIAYGAPSVRYFRKFNLGILRNSVISSGGTNYNLTAKGGSAVPNYLKVSQGNLPAFSASVDEGVMAFYGSNATLAAADNVTVEEFKKAYPNIQGGDQLTLVKIVKTAGSLVDGDAIFALRAERIVFAPNAFDDPNINIFSNGSMNEDLLDLTKTTNTTMLSSVDGGAGLGLGFTASADNTYAAALILSRKVNGAWQRSTQFMELCMFDDAADNAAAIASYGATESINTQNEYLNQAKKAQGKTGVRGAYALFTNQINEELIDNLMVDPGQSDSSEAGGDVDNMVYFNISAFGDDTKRPVKCKIQKGSGEVLATGINSCCYSFKLATATAINYTGIVTWSDGSTSDVAWPVTIANP